MNIGHNCMTPHNIANVLFDSNNGAFLINLFLVDFDHFTPAGDKHFKVETYVWVGFDLDNSFTVNDTIALGIWKIISARDHRSDSKGLG